MTAAHHATLCPVQCCSAADQQLYHSKQLQRVLTAELCRVLHQIKLDAADTQAREMNNLSAVCRVLLGNEFYVETFTEELILTVSHTAAGHKLCLLI